MTFQRRILIVEDDAFMGSLMIDALKSRGFESKHASNAADATRELQKFDPDAVLVDIDLGKGPSGIEFIRVVRKAFPHVAAILLSKHPDLISAGYKNQDVPEGVAYLRKSLVENTDELIAAIDEVTQGHVEKIRQDKQGKGSLDLLTKTQREILELMALGLSNVEIARQRAVTVSAIEKRITEIFDAFGIQREDSVVPRVVAIRRYLSENGILTKAE